MTVLLVLFTIVFFLVVDHFKTRPKTYVVPREAYISPGFEALGALCNDGGKKKENKV
jgi:hypothetical protein